MAVVSLLLGIGALLCAIEDGQWDAESFGVFISLSAGAVVLGIMSIVKQSALFGLGIAGMVLTVIAWAVAL